MAEWYTPLSIYPIASSGRGLTSELDLGPFGTTVKKRIWFAARARTNVAYVMLSR